MDVMRNLDPESFKNMQHLTNLKSYRIFLSPVLENCKFSCQIQKMHIVINDYSPEMIGVSTLIFNSTVFP